MTRRAILSGWPPCSPPVAPAPSPTQTGPTDQEGRRARTEVRPRTPGPAYRVTVQDVISNFNGAP